jgi:hypothetical protein
MRLGTDRTSMLFGTRHSLAPSSPNPSYVARSLVNSVNVSAPFFVARQPSRYQKTSDRKPSATWCEERFIRYFRIEVLLDDCSGVAITEWCAISWVRAGPESVLAALGTANTIGTYTRTSTLSSSSY